MVISILTILISLLFPSLKSLIHNANNTKCMNKLKNIGKAWMMYADDHMLYPDYGSPMPNASNSNNAARRSSLWLASNMRDPILDPPAFDGPVRDLRPILQSYLGSLNETMICPLASSLWFKKPGINNRYDIDGVKIYSNQRFAQPSYMLYPSSHSENSFLGTKQQMRRPGDTFILKRGTGQDMEYGLLASDILFADNGNQLYSTQGPYTSDGTTGGGANMRPRAWIFEVDDISVDINHLADLPNIDNLWRFNL